MTHMFFEDTYSRLLDEQMVKQIQILVFSFNSNRAVVIRNQIVIRTIRTLIGPFINNKMNAFLKLLADSNFE